MGEMWMKVKTVDAKSRNRFSFVSVLLHETRLWAGATWLGLAGDRYRFRLSQLI